MVTKARQTVALVVIVQFVALHVRGQDQFSRRAELESQIRQLTEKELLLKEQNDATVAFHKTAKAHDEEIKLKKLTADEEKCDEATDGRPELTEADKVKCSKLKSKRKDFEAKVKTRDSKRVEEVIKNVEEMKKIPKELKRLRAELETIELEKHMDSKPSGLPVATSETATVAVEGIATSPASESKNSGPGESTDRTSDMKRAEMERIRARMDQIDKDMVAYDKRLSDIEQLKPCKTRRPTEDKEQ